MARSGTTNWLGDSATDDQEQEVRDLEHMSRMEYSHTEWSQDGVGRPIYRHVFLTSWDMEPAP